MTVRIRFLNEHPLLVEESLSLFLNHSRIEAVQIVHREENKQVEIPLHRRMFDFEKTLFGKKVKYRKEYVRSVLRLESVERVDIRKAEEPLKMLGGIFTVLFGLKMDKQEIYMSSAEEDEGKPIVEIIVYVSRMDMELVDLE